MNMRHLIFYLIVAFFVVPISVGAHEEAVGDSWMMPGMGFGAGNVWPWFMFFGFIIWLGVGILLAALLWKQITKK